MGKQICFFVTGRDIDQLIFVIKENGGIIINEDGYELNDFELSKIADEEYCRKRFRFSSFFIKLPTSNIYFEYYEKVDRKCVDQFSSEVIQFGQCKPQLKMIVDTSSIDNNFEKGGFVVINDSGEYYRQLDELMKNPNFIDNPNYVHNGFEHGRLWYDPIFHNSKGMITKKSKELDVLFNKLSKFIKMNYKLTADKFAYIGHEAYEKYHEGVFVPSSGRNVIKVD